MLARVAAVAAGVTIGAGIVQNRPPMPGQQSTVAGLLLLVLMSVCWYAGTRRPAESGGVHASSRSDASANAGVVLNLHGQPATVDPALVAAVLAVVESRSSGPVTTERVELDPETAPRLVTGHNDYPPAWAQAPEVLDSRP